MDAVGLIQVGCFGGCRNAFCDLTILLNAGYEKLNPAVLDFSQLFLEVSSDMAPVKPAILNEDFAGS